MCRAQKFASFHSAKDREHVTGDIGRISRGSLLQPFAAFCGLLQPLSSFEGRVFVLGLAYRSHRGVGTLRLKCLGKGMELETMASVVSRVSRLLS